MPPVTTCLPSDLALAEGAGADVPRVGVLGTEDEVVVDEILEVLAELRRAVTFETITGPRLAGIAVAGSCVGAPGAEAVAENWVARAASVETIPDEIEDTTAELAVTAIGVLVVIAAEDPGAIDVELRQ
ncbi:hypothetical protein MMC34_006687 [Xylographa carneopallida]|nr:hypothetical protein [Xylographa carneopallida]